MQKIFKLSGIAAAISLSLTNTKLLAQCGNMPTKSVGNTVYVMDLPGSYVTVDIAHGVIVFPQAGYPLGTFKVGTLSAIHNNYIEQVRAIPTGPEFSVEGPEFSTSNL